MGLFKLKLNINFGPFLQELPKGLLVARIYNDATNLTNNFPYFWSVEAGRRPVLPVRKKALRWLSSPATITPFPSERFKSAVFTKRAGPARAQNLRGRAIQDVIHLISGLEKVHDMTRVSLAALVNRAAIIVTAALARKTPRRSGSLARGYRIDPAG